MRDASIATALLSFVIAFSLALIPPVGTDAHVWQLVREQQHASEGELPKEVLEEADDSAHEERPGLEARRRNVVGALRGHLRRQYEFLSEDVGLRDALPEKTLRVFYDEIWERSDVILRAIEEGERLRVRDILPHEVLRELYDATGVDTDVLLGGRDLDEFLDDIQREYSEIDPN